MVKKKTSVLGAKQPRDHRPCRSPCDSVDGEVLDLAEEETKEAIPSMPLSPFSRLHVRSFSGATSRRSVSSNTVLQCGGAVLENGNERFAGEELFDEKWEKILSLVPCLEWQKGYSFLFSCATDPFYSGVTETIARQPKPSWRTRSKCLVHCWMHHHVPSGISCGS